MLQLGDRQAAARAGDDEAVLELARRDRAFARGRLPVPRGRGGVADDEGAERAVRKFSTAAAVSSTGKPRVLFEAVACTLSISPHDHAQAIDVVDGVDQDRSAARLAPPRHIEIVVRLAVQPGAVRGDDLPSPPLATKSRAACMIGLWRR